MPGAKPPPCSMRRRPADAWRPWLCITWAKAKASIGDMVVLGGAQHDNGSGPGKGCRLAGDVVCFAHQGVASCCPRYHLWASMADYNVTHEPCGVGRVAGDWTALGLVEAPALGN